MAAQRAQSASLATFQKPGALLPQVRAGTEVDTIANRPFPQALLRPQDVAVDGPAIFPRATAAGGMGNIKMVMPDIQPTADMLALAAQGGTFVGPFQSAKQAVAPPTLPDTDADSNSDGSNALIVAAIGVAALIAIVMMAEYNR